MPGNILKALSTQNEQQLLIQCSILYTLNLIAIDNFAITSTFCVPLQMLKEETLMQRQ